MKIIISIPCLNRGGTEIQTLNLARILIGVGHTVTTLCYFEYDSDMVNEFEQAGCQVELMKLERGSKPWKIIKLLRTRFKSLKPDVVHIQYMAPGALPIIAARLAGVKKIIATVHQPYTPSHGRLAKLLLRFSAGLCTRFIAVSQNAETSWFGSGSLFDENKSLNAQPGHFTIYNAVDVARLGVIQQQIGLQKVKQVPGVPSGHLVIGVVSRLRHEKGIDLLIRSFALVLKKYPVIHLLIVGTGPDEVKLKEMVLDLKLEQNTTFFGEANWETAMQQMASMDVVVVPSRFEGFGLTAAEAMAMGKPVVASEVFGLSEVVTDGQTGFLFPSEDTETLATCLVRLCTDPDLRLTMGTNGKAKAEKLFELSVFKRKTLGLYEKLMC